MQHDFDERVIPILRWSIIIQIVFSLVSVVGLRLFPPPGGLSLNANFFSLLPIIFLCLILIFLFIPRTQSYLNKRTILVILFIIALLAILFRNSTYMFVEERRPRPEINLYRFDALFFLIMPLVFIAWQYSLKEVMVYCFLITLLESTPSFMMPGDEAVFRIISILTIVGRGLILIIVGWILNSLVSIQHSQQQQLIEANQKIRKHAITIELLAQSQERNRLARELHDTLAHTLSGAIIQLEAIKAMFNKKPKQAQAMLDQVLENTRHGLGETRKALLDLRSSELETYGLAQSIRNVVRAGAERLDYRAEVHTRGKLDGLPDEVNHCMYRIVQESIENVIRHSKAEHVQVLLKREPQAVHLSIQDDGVGFDAKEGNRPGMGIRGMRERVEMLNGEFHLETLPGKGTLIDVVLGLDHD